MITKTNLNQSHWSLDEGYRNEFSESEYPFRVLESGQKNSLELILTSNMQDSDYMCNHFFHGFEYSITLPGQSFEMLSDILSIDLSEDNLVTVKPKVTKTSEVLRNYKPEHRNCFFNSERQLRFFRMYTEENCLEECATNYIKKMCGCAHFAMPSM